MNRMLSAVAIAALLMTASCSPPTASTGGEAAQGPALVLPEWTADLVGKNIADAFTTTMANDGCIGFVDASTAEGGGQRVVGWAWSTMHSRAYDHLVATDANGVIVGGGSTDNERTDVPAVNANVTTPLVGYTVLVQGSGPISVWGVNEAASTRCLIGTSQ